MPITRLTPAGMPSQTTIRAKNASMLTLDGDPPNNPIIPPKVKIAPIISKIKLVISKIISLVLLV